MIGPLRSSLCLMIELRTGLASETEALEDVRLGLGPDNEDAKILGCASCELKAPFITAAADDCLCCAPVLAVSARPLSTNSLGLAGWLGGGVKGCIKDWAVAVLVERCDLRLRRS